jgi:hypothetical protein
MVNEGSPNPSAIVVNLSEDTRQADPSKLHVTATTPGGAQGMQAFPGSQACDGGATVVVVSREIPPGVTFHLRAYDGRGGADGDWRLKIDGQVAALSSTSAAQRTAEKSFEPEFRIGEGKVLSLEVTNAAGIAETFEAVLRGWDESVV